MHAADLMKTSGRSVRQHSQVRRATRLLSEAIVLLNACGVTSAVAHSRLALSEAEAVVQQALAAQAAAAKVRQRPVPPMPCNQSALIRSDGTLRYLSYMKRSGKRPAVVAVSFRVPGLPSLTTSFTLVDRSFEDVYEVAVRSLARHVGVIDDIDLLRDMLLTSNAFKTRYRL